MEGERVLGDVQKKRVREESMHHGGDEEVSTDHVDTERVGTLLPHQPHTQD